MLFGCLNCASGRLDPSYGTLARLTNISVRSVARDIEKLNAASVLHWLWRCVESWKDGCFTLAWRTVPCNPVAHPSFLNRGRSDG
jgi:hypothetical protein